MKISEIQIGGKIIGGGGYSPPALPPTESLSWEMVGIELSKQSMELW